MWIMQLKQEYTARRKSEPHTGENDSSLNLSGQVKQWTTPIAFREDLLRGIGNGVVWQTAMKAFIDLNRKLL